MSLVSTDWVQKNINNVKIIDSSWHMPNVKRNGYKEYLETHIENAIFFDLDKNSDQMTDLPHMLTTSSDWEKIVSKMGISKDDEIVVYDNSDVLSSCRCWYNFIYFGHNDKLIHVLNGGLKKWKSENKPTTNIISKFNTTKYTAFERKNLVKNKKEINKNINSEKFKVIDARSRERFEGKVAEPRKGLRSGSIPKSTCLPFGDLINNDNTFKNENEILNVFKNILGEEITTNIVFSCGSGVTASVLALAYSLINNKYMPTIYDGSWAEYGKTKI
jgi:thiosulfate/3-mercaptopyruvate sulfurtransferase